MRQVLQVLRDYCRYADPLVGCWHVKEDGHKSPSVRVLVKPLLNLFHGERKNKRWKCAIDKMLLEKPGPQTVTEVIDRTLPILDDGLVDAPPDAVTCPPDLFTAEQTGEWPPPALPRRPLLDRELVVS